MNDKRRDTRPASRDLNREIIDMLQAEEQNGLEHWTAFSEAISVPQDMLPALLTGRAELAKLATPRDMTADEVRKLYDVIGTLITTNIRLRQHAERTAQLVSTWAASFKQLRSLGEQIEDFANYRHPEIE